jgi:hypothetical protein
MPIPRCDLTTLTGRAIAALNAATAGAWSTTITSSDDDRRSTTEIQKAILAADARVCEARGSNPQDELLRPLLMSPSSSIAHAGVMPEHLGPVDQVLIQYATGDTNYRAGKSDEAVTLADIENWRANGAALYGAAHDAGGTVSGFFVKRGNQLFYTGADAKAQIATFTRSGACQAPEVDEDTVLGLAVESLIKEGDAGSAVGTLIAAARADLTRLAGA